MQEYISKKGVLIIQRDTYMSLTYLIRRHGRISGSISLLIDGCFDEKICIILNTNIHIKMCQQKNISVKSISRKNNTKSKQTCFFCFTCIVIVRLCFIDLGEQLCPRLLNFFELILHIFLFFEGHHGLKKKFFFKKSL